MFHLFFSSTYAQDAAPAQGLSQGTIWAQSVPFILIFVIFYFLLIRPQKKRMQREQEMLKSLEKGVEVFTKSGILGTIVGITDAIVTLQVDQQTKIKVLRGEIAGPAKRFLDSLKERENGKSTDVKGVDIK